MIDVDANTHALNHYLSGEEQYERAAECFDDEATSLYIEVEALIDELMSMAKAYSGYDMTEEVKMAVGDML